MIDHIDPVTDIFSGTVDRHFFPCKRFVTKNGISFSGILEWAEIVCASGYDDR